MKKFTVFALLIAGFISASDAATPVQRRGRTGTSTDQTAEKTVSARTATTARAATRTPTNSSNVTVRSRTDANPTKNVTARAATTQKAISTGTKVSGAAKNILVNEECMAKYEGCMDAFCMLDNENGGRCICSNKNAEFDHILSEIERLDQQTYQMATLGVERLEMGADADIAISMAQNATKTAPDNSSKRTLDLSLWDTPVDMDFDTDIFGSNSTPIDGKTGDALHTAAAELCSAQIPECAGELTMMKMMYGQKIRSDCAAYENSLKQQLDASTKKLTTTESTLRQTALDQYRAANRYDLGQCTIEFTKCMQTTAECGDDFSGCATMAAMDATNTRKSTSKTPKSHFINGDMTTIEINASTYDALMAKKPLCDTITKSCVDVADQVWDAFLRNAGPRIKSAELIAEDNARQSCIGNISSCFQQACKDTIDPNDPDGSYDLCLTRPETMLNLCRVPLNACGIDASSADAAQKSDIWGFVVARLASMRVDSCTTAVKECLQSTDRCGSDYSQCIGLDTDTIMRMCPHEKLVGCQMAYGDDEITGNAVYDELANMVQGIMLNIDNNMLTQCQNALNESLIRVCGNTENCDKLVVDNGVGERSFKYQVCQYTDIVNNEIKWNGVCRDSLDAITKDELLNPANGVAGWAGKISGTMYWGDIAYSCPPGNDTNTAEECHFTTEAEYIATLKDAGYTLDTESRDIITNRVFGVEMRALINAVDMAIATIESDPMVQYCTSGRRVQGMNTSDGATRRDLTGGARFPNLTSQVRKMIANSALKTARTNYNKRYDAEIARMMQDQVKAAQRIDADAAQQTAATVCANWAEQSTLPQSKAPKASNAGKWIALGLLVAAAIVAIAITGGGAAAIIAAKTTEAIVTATVTGAVLAAGAGTGAAIVANNIDPVGTANVEQWNFKQNVTTTFAPTTGVCTKVTVYQQCKETKKNYCDKWADPVETRDEVQLL